MNATEQAAIHNIYLEAVNRFHNHGGSTHPIRVGVPRLIWCRAGLSAVDDVSWDSASVVVHDYDGAAIRVPILPTNENEYQTFPATGF